MNSFFDGNFIFGVNFGVLALFFVLCFNGEIDKFINFSKISNARIRDILYILCKIGLCAIALLLEYFLYIYSINTTGRSISLGWLILIIAIFTHSIFVAKFNNILKK